MSKSKRSTKVSIWVTPEAYERLNELSKEYGCKSTYELIQRLIGCFLRALSHNNSNEVETISDEVQQIFNELHEAEKHMEFEKPKRSASYKSVLDEEKRA